MRAFFNAITANYMTFTGRMSRKDYWSFILVYVIVAVLIEILEIFLLTCCGGKIWYLMISYLYHIALLPPMVAAGVRRLHDIGKNCGWMLLFLIPVAGWIWLVYLLSEHSNLSCSRYGPAGDQTNVSNGANTNQE